MTLSDFLLRLFADAKGEIELRALSGKGSGGPQVFARDRATLDTFIAAQVAAGKNLFFSCCTRQDHKGDATHCVQAAALWADIDFKSLPAAEAEAHLARFPLPPSIVVHSGGGLHAYWVLSEPLDAQHPRLRPTLRGLALALRADIAVAEVARIMRLPGSSNYKYAPPRPVVIVKADFELRYSFEQFADFEEVVPATSNGATFGLRVPTGVNLREALAAKLNLRVHEADGVTRFEYHGLPALQGGLQPCLIQGTVHAQNGNNPRQCCFFAKDGLFWHSCFSSDCQSTTDAESKTRIAVRKLGLEGVLLFQVIEPQAVELPDMPAAVLTGRLGELCQKRMQDFPIALGWPALLTGAGALIRVNESPLRANLFTALVGDVNCGKSSAIERANFLLDVKPDLLLRLKSGSGEGLLMLIGDRHGDAGLLFPDELAHTLEKAQIQNSQFAAILSSLFYQDEETLTIAHGKVVNFDCRLSLIGGITEEKFGDAFGASTVAGLYDRFLFGQNPTSFSHAWRPNEGASEIVDTFDAVRVDREVWQARDDIAKAEGLSRRVLEIALRCASICAALDGRDALRAKDLAPAWELARYQTRVRMLLRPNPGKNFEAQVAQKFLNYLQRNAPKGEFVRLRSVLKATSAYDYGPSVIERALRAMQFGGTIEEAIEDRGKTKQRCRLVRLCVETMGEGA